MSKSNLSLETHAYDGSDKIRKLYENISINLNKNITLKQAYEGLLGLMMSDKTHFAKIAIDMLKHVFNGESTDEKGVNVHTLLILIWQYASVCGIDDYVLEQFADIQNGPCIQGRSMRLLQIVLTMY